MKVYVKQAKNNPDLQRYLALTIHSHYIEKKFGDNSRARLFLRSLDRSGLSIAIQTNPQVASFYQRKIASYCAEFDKNEHVFTNEAFALLRYPEMYERIQYMAYADLAEEAVFKALKKGNPDYKSQLNSLPPLFEREYDNRGIPISYRLNPKITTVSDDPDNQEAILVNIDGFPLTTEHDNQINTSTLCDLLTSSNI